MGFFAKIRGVWWLGVFITAFYLNSFLQSVSFDTRRMDYSGRDHLFFLRCLSSDSPRRYWFLFMGLGFRFALGCILAEALLFFSFFFFGDVMFLFIWFGKRFVNTLLCCIFFEAFERPFFLLSSLCVVFFGHLSISTPFLPIFYIQQLIMYDDCSVDFSENFVRSTGFCGEFVG